MLTFLYNLLNFNWYKILTYDRIICQELLIKFYPDLIIRLRVILNIVKLIGKWFYIKIRVFLVLSLHRSYQLFY
jgi:hypothetical protein